jgi:Predicted methyltransferase regulatory domain
VREIMLHRFSRTEDPAKSVAEGMEFLRFVIECRAEDDPFRALLEKEAKQMQSKRPEVVYHDEMASEFRPVLVTNFVAHARRHGLQYVSESVLPPPNDPCFQPQIAATAKALAAGDRIAEEQTLDFARMRVYRETLLCRAECAVDDDLCLEAITRLRLASRAESTPGEGSVLRVFTLPDGIRMESQDAGTVALMGYLIEAWPRSVAFPELIGFLEAKDAGVDAGFLIQLMRLVVTRMVELHAWQAPVSRGIAERPRASAVSRQEAATQDRATTLLHGSLRLDDPLVRRFLVLLDGTRDREELLEALRVEFPETPEATLKEGIGPALRVLHGAGALLEDGFR